MYSNSLCFNSSVAAFNSSCRFFPPKNFLKKCDSTAILALANLSLAILRLAAASCSSTPISVFSASVLSSDCSPSPYSASSYSSPKYLYRIACSYGVKSSGLSSFFGLSTLGIVVLNISLSITFSSLYLETSSGLTELESISTPKLSSSLRSSSVVG